MKIAIVTFEGIDRVLPYREETRWPWPLLIDANRQTYRSYGMFSASFWDVWGPKTWWAYLKEVARGQKLKRSTGDILQRGGDVLVDPTGIVRLHHVGRGPADRPAVGTILRGIGDAFNPFH